MKEQMPDRVTGLQTAAQRQKIYDRAYEKGILEEPIIASDDDGVLKVRIGKSDGEQVLIETVAAAE